MTEASHVQQEQISTYNTTDDLFSDVHKVCVLVSVFGGVRASVHG